MSRVFLKIIRNILFTIVKYIIFMLNIVDNTRGMEYDANMEVMNLKNLKVKFARLEKDISQTELARRVGVTRQTIGMIEAGDYNPTLKLCIAICKELDKTLNDLFWEEE